MASIYIVIALGCYVYSTLYTDWGFPHTALPKYDSNYNTFPHSDEIMMGHSAERLGSLQLIRVVSTTESRKVKEVDMQDLLIGTSGRHFSRSPFGRSTCNDVSGH